MGLLKNVGDRIGRLFQSSADEAPGPPGPSDDYWYGSVGGYTPAGLHITPDIALKSSALYSVSNFLAEIIATIPVGMCRQITPKILEYATEHPLNELIAWQPNETNTAVEFWQTMVLHACLMGCGYAEIVPGARGAVDQLLPIASEVTRRRNKNGRLTFHFYDSLQGRQRTLLQEEMFQIPGMSFDGWRPLRIIDLAADALGIGIAADQYAARIFSNNLNFGYILEHPAALSPEAQKNLIQQLMMRFAGVGNAHRPIILQEGMKANKASQTAEEAQLLEARKWQIAEIARFFRIPLSMLGIYDGATHSNVEQQALDLVKYTLRPWLTRIQQAIRRDLIIAKGVYVAHFDVDDLLRGDHASLGEYYSKALGAGGSPAWMTQNEVREDLGRKPLPGGDALPQPTNSTTEPRKKPPAASREACAGLLRKEIAAARRCLERNADNPEAVRAWASAFYGGHVSGVMAATGLPREAAKAYCGKQRHDFLTANDWPSLLERWEASRAAELFAALEAHR